ncbi:MAG: metallophosphoesterase family protein [Candidatus Oleimicrobiaceae bacterium]
MRLGLIADTHGCLPSSVLGHFSGVELILHAGDIGSWGVLDELAKVAPVAAVVGNMDGPPLTASHPVHRFVEAEGITILLVHRPPSLREVESIACQEGVQAVHVVVHGHTHQQRLEERQGILFVNPGAAGGPGGSHSVAVLILGGKSPQLEFWEVTA